MKSVFKLVVISLLFTSCASRLKVVVKVADREQVLKMADASLKAEVLPSVIALENFIDSWNEEALLEEIYASVEKKLGASLRDTTKIEYKEEFRKQFGPKIILIRGFIDETRRKYDANNVNDAFTAINKAILEITSIQKLLKEYKEDKDLDPNRMLGVQEETVTMTAKTAIAGTERTRFPILGDPLTSQIAKKENEMIWKSVFNETVSWSFLGNSDIAFILRSNPPEKEIKSGDYNNNFTIKGVRMDAADATNALITGLTQTMNFIANTQGISIPMPQQTANTDPVPVQNTLIMGLFADTMAYETKKKKLEDYKKMLIEKIKMEGIETKQNEELNDAIKRIEDYWTSLKVELNKP
ncbi:hypothetical protein [uncultured Flavobacterium sp.]|uniref:hypothetical protein n=1 Tax=uncultured Flavobacterium sp. TaxID=165435 RepID=UPI0012276266|nr:hypothetical protein [uncultured Flavobacterium sp.]THD32483.1 MAG: hypothetical protein DI588_07660 [Flavobacterium johnsoniae]